MATKKLSYYLYFIKKFNNVMFIVYTLIINAVEILFKIQIYAKIGIDIKKELRKKFIII